MFLPMLQLQSCSRFHFVSFREGPALAKDWSDAGEWIEELVWRDKRGALHLITDAIERGNITRQCSNALDTFRSGLAGRRLWAFQMLDSTSLGDSGFINRFVDFGDYDLCLSVSAPNDQFHGQHCLVRLDFSLPPPAVKDSLSRVDISNTTMQGTWLEKCASSYKYLYFEKITSGICFPSSCQPKEIEHYLNAGEESLFCAIT